MRQPVAKIDRDKWDRTEVVDIKRQRITNLTVVKEEKHTSKQKKNLKNFSTNAAGKTGYRTSEE
jgi:hypothetical protein